MEVTGFFAIHIDDPGQVDPSDVEDPASQGELEQAVAAKSRYTLHLGWMEGKPYLVDLGSAGQILVNGAPIAPRRPVPIEVGDRISIGDAHLTWHAGAAIDRSTRVLEGPPSAKVTVVLPESAPERHDEPAPAQVADETLLTAKRPTAAPAEAQVPEETPVAPPGDETLLAPGKVPRAAAAGAVDPTLIVPERTAPPPLSASAPDEGVTPGESAYEPGEAFTYPTVWVDVAQLLDQPGGEGFESTTILRDTRTPHLVIHLPDRTWEVPLADKRMTIGRSDDNDLPIPDTSLSRHHAAIEPHGDHYVVRDAGSTNGVWVGRGRVEEHRLGAGDVIRLGRARLVFKGGFTSDDLTLIRPPRIDGKPARRPVVFVPGLMGSELWIGSEQIWPNLKYLISNPEIYLLPGDPRIEARNIVSDVVIVPNVIKLRQYSGLGDYLEAGLGYERGKDLLEFAYDWRQDVRLAAQSLAETIERWQVQAPITVIAHSLGTLVTRYYVERLGGKRVVERILLMGGPHYGTPGAVAALLTGPGMLPMGVGDERLRDVLSVFPSAYQILPSYPSVTDQHGETMDLFNDDTWLPEHQRPLLSAACSFWRELGLRSSVPAVSIFGYGMKTKLHATIHRRPDGQWQKVEFTEDTAGDSSVPSGSAVLKGSEIHPVFQDHGSLYMDDDVRMRLKVELTRSTTWRKRWQQ